MTNYVHEGKTLTMTASYNIPQNGGLKVGNLFGVVVGSIQDPASAYAAPNGTSCEVVTQGVFDLVKDPSTFAEGDLVYWDDTAKKATSTVGANLLIGMVELHRASGTDALGALTGDATVRVKLTGVPGFSGQANGVKVAHALINFATDSGTVAAHIPANSDTIPQYALVYGGIINVPTAVDSSGHGASLVIGTSAGSSANGILSVTAQATLSIDAVIKPTCATTPFKMSAAGQINYTPSGETITLGLIEVWVFYTTANEA
jgi:predicted RecA/RadA family phage recombinase